ncbi:PHP domain-containing protein [Clostridium sp. BJN0001]|uniref:PHP domain-containing protein n=1 Tax=Clostridium sp. BJN0001 TaxID=2930219 RepID=UPI001FD5762B|nr:PHP domain-containing protein [Clostridium sp. BJN0001]
MEKCDFHIHTIYSDGLLSPSEIILLSDERNQKYIAITDHDTTEGLDDAINLSKNANVKLIPGIELSTSYKDKSVHILGFFKKDSYKNKDLNSKLTELQNYRVIRAKKIVQKLKDEFNIIISVEKLLKNSKDTVARPNIAREIINAGYPYTHEYIFNNFIGENCKAYVRTKKINTKDGINFLKDNGAVVFLAHPKLIHKEYLQEVLKLHFDGIEAIYSQNTNEENSYFIDYAKKNNLLISCGSDFHGNPTKDKKHGDLGCVELSRDDLNKFLSALDIK